MSANAFNVARRLSSRNEPDLLQEDMMLSDPIDEEEEPMFTKKYCEMIASKIPFASSLPPECNKFSGLVASVERRDSNKHDHAVAFAGMSAGEATAAMSARDSHLPSHAQIQRRMTNKNHKGRFY